ncbi:MAG: MBL fold metallo-hydrolase [Bacteroidetes bacterium]|nr:MBL fold metallo-hydrolase [Bacteroidota bacterium]
MTTKLQFWGAAENVTGSLHHIITQNGKHIFLDCGLFQGRRQESIEKNKNFPIPAEAVDAIILSHAHLDHSGNLPGLVKQGFSGKIYATPATADLIKILLSDSAHLMKRDLEYLNKRRVSRGQEPIEPLYSQDDVEQTLELLVPVNYLTPTILFNEITFTFFDAGHILGSAITELKWKDAISDTETVLVFTGDLGRDHLPILKDPTYLHDADYIITESTYGGRLHDSIEKVGDDLAKIIKETVKHRGKIIIPAFSVGRTQEILYEIAQLKGKNLIPDIPIYLDSPMAIEATQIFNRHLECFDDETMAQLKAGKNPLFPPGVFFLKTTDESKELNEIDFPCMIISASGMCEGGRVVHHIANNCGRRENVILFVGYQGQHTLGRKIMDGADEITMFGETHRVNCRIEKILAFSAHADEQELISWLQHFNKKRLKKLFLVHGESEAQNLLIQSLNTSGFNQIHIGKQGEIIKLI